MAYGSWHTPRDNDTTRWCPKKSTSIERRAIKRKRPRKLIIVGIVVPYRGNRESKPDDLFQTGQTSSISFRRPKSPDDEDLVQRKEEDCLLTCAKRLTLMFFEEEKSSYTVQVSSLLKSDIWRCAHSPSFCIIILPGCVVQPFVRYICDSIAASDGVATQPRLNHKLGVRYDPFYLGCIGATAEVERKPDASESSQLPTFRATTAANLRNALLLIKEQSLGDFISHKDGKGFEGNDRNLRNISERRIPEEK
ncbi:hypothetical protein G5I_04935 [Acromyrmex echinatior]|uniref:Uncharacterized protein n=1 Tax=Acromyrmex echinatior TaxID=103372 RepID=F4WGY3_ACREC|nr:hypothetical protein G5I_04935 [Acromyrmex echinatior]